MPKIDTLNEEYSFILAFWKFVKHHRRYTDTIFAEAEELAKAHPEVKYAPEMIKAYLERLEVKK